MVNLGAPGLQHFIDGDQLITRVDQLRKQRFDRRHRFRVNVMHQNDRAILDRGHGILHRLYRVEGFPIQRVDTPHD